MATWALRLPVALVCAALLWWAGTAIVRVGSADGARRARNVVAARAPAVEPELSLPPPANGVPVLMYHQIGGGPNDLCLPREEFAAQMRYLAQNGFHSVTLEQLHTAMFGGSGLPPHPVVLTFDDDSAGHYRTVFPLLAAHGFTGVFFIDTVGVGKPGRVTWDQLREMQAAGMQIGSHTETHVDLPGIGGRRLAAETAGARARLEKELGVPVVDFSYPSGHYDKQTIRAVAGAGYRDAVTTHHVRDEVTRRSPAGCRRRERSPALWPDSMRQTSLPLRHLVGVRCLFRALPQRATGDGEEPGDDDAGEERPAAHVVVALYRTGARTCGGRGTRTGVEPCGDNPGQPHTYLKDDQRQRPQQCPYERAVPDAGGSVSRAGQSGCHPAARKERNEDPDEPPEGPCAAYWGALGTVEPNSSAQAGEDHEYRDRDQHPGPHGSPAHLLDGEYRRHRAGRRGVAAPLAGLADDVRILRTRLRVRLSF